MRRNSSLRPTAWMGGCSWAWERRFTLWISRQAP
jgi:hypothetical protein